MTELEFTKFRVEIAKDNQKTLIDILNQFSIIDYSDHIFLKDMSNKELAHIFFNLILKGVNVLDWIERRKIQNTTIIKFDRSNLFDINNRELYVYNDLLEADREIRKYYFLSNIYVSFNYICLEQDVNALFNKLDEIDMYYSITGDGTIEFKE